MFKLKSIITWTEERLGSAAPAHLLREYLHNDAPSRERSAMRVFAGIFLASIPGILLMGPVQGWRLTISLTLVLAAMCAYCFAFIEVLGRGWYHPAAPWVNVFIEVSIPVPFMLVELSARGPTYALTSPATSLWTGLVVFSALRADPRLCLGAGAVAAAELIGLSVYMHGMGVIGSENATFPWIIQRSLYLVFAGFAGALVARSLVRKAEDALRAVREQDLMGKYFLHNKLGSGGMAEVFRATYSPEGGFQKTVAIKRILPALAKRPHFTELFLDEARLCALLNHPNVVQVFDVGRYRDTFIIAMEFVDGVSLQALLATREDDLPLSAISYLGAELGAALDYLHARIGPDGEPLALVHRDVNPPNILISRFGEVKLADFGVAHAATLTTPQEPGHFVGKTLYAAPEQRRCEQIDRKADLFALGLTLYEAITGRTVAWEKMPDGGRADFGSMIAPPSQYRKQTPRELDAVVMSLLEFNPDRRPSTGGRVREKLTGMKGPAAPYPHGQRLLAEAVKDLIDSHSQASDAGSLTEDAYQTVSRMSEGQGKTVVPILPKLSPGAPRGPGRKVR